ncbi:MAG: exodeoxyribonuclease VII small subunit [Patescibacteria group bacterium]
MIKKQSSQTLQQLFDELEAIVAQFEKGGIDLDKSLELFERGLELATLCKSRLKEVENKVIDIKKKFSLTTHNEDES